MSEFRVSLMIWAMLPVQTKHSVMLNLDTYILPFTYMKTTNELMNSGEEY